MDLPSDIYRVYPESWNNRNIYTTEKSVKYALHYRLRSRWVKEEDIKVFQVVGVTELGGLVWRDVTGRFLRELL